MIDIAEILLIFLFGLGVGSFLNVLIDRLSRGESFVKGRSYCESCRTSLKWHDLIPVLSFVMLKAKCRYCRVPLSLYYPAIELITGLMFVSAIIFIQSFTSEESFVHLRSGTESLLGGEFLELGYYLFIFSSLIVIFFTDMKYGIIPDAVTFTSTGIVAIYLFMIHPSADGLFLIHLLSALGAFLFFLLIFLATRGRGMGFGDVKFVFLMGLVLGFPKVIVGLYAAFLTGAIISIILILGKKKKFKGSTIPFGPFLVLGTILAIFWGEEFLQKAVPLILGR